MIQVWEFLKGRKTYLMAAVIGLDATGVALGWWDDGKLRQITEGIFTLLALRSGISASGPVAPVK